MSPTRAPLQHPLVRQQQRQQPFAPAFVQQLSIRPHFNRASLHWLERSVDTTYLAARVRKIPTKLLNNPLRFRFSSDYDEQVLPLPDPGNPPETQSNRRDFDPTAQSQMKLRRFV